jgi:hypothetical protein
MVVGMYVFWLRQPCGIALLNEVENNHSRKSRNYYFAEIANNFRGSQAKPVPMFAESAFYLWRKVCGSRQAKPVPMFAEIAFCNLRNPLARKRRSV